MNLVIVTGISGAGKSCVVNAFEDIGWFCVDNLPVEFIPQFVKKIINETKHENIAIVTDIRAGLTSYDLKNTIETLSQENINVTLLFVNCKRDEIFKRYKQSRRSHPLIKNESDTLMSAIEKEKELLAPVKQMANYVIDTTLLLPYQTKQRVISTFTENKNKTMHIHVVSFGFKHGIPQDADYVFDTRFLPNPFYIDELKILTGLDERVSSFVMNNNSAIEFEKHLLNMISFVVPMCINEGRGQLVIAIGCTGGHHRSVTFTERTALYLKKNNYSVCITHRDIEK